MAKKKAKAATTRKTTTKRKPMTMAQSAKNAQKAPTFLSGEGRLTDWGRPGRSGKPQKAKQDVVKLYKGGNQKNPTMMAAKKGNMTFFDTKGKKVSQKAAATKGGNLRTGYTMRMSGGGGRTADVIGGGDAS